MKRQFGPTTALLSLGCAALGLTLGGCPAPVDNVDAKNNGSFQSATPIDLPAANDVIEFAGSLDSNDKVDLYNLGVLQAGDHVVVDVSTSSGDLDPVAAVFDYQERVHAFNDDRESDASDLNPRMDFTVRGAKGEYFLGVASFPGSDTSGNYRVSVVVTRGQDTSAPQPQTVFLDFDGGRGIVVQNVGAFDLQPFSSTDVGPFPGKTAELKDMIQNVVMDRFEGFALELLNSDDHAVPTGEHSTIYFGGSSVSAFAISEQLDTLNADPGDNAIIFTRSFLNAFSTTPTIEQIATAVGNTVAHEIGHLLGLVHTRECESLMDTTCGNDSILIKQTFQLAPIDDSVFPVGMQDARDLIGWAIGFAGL
jgi:predicted Zn-dependent protease with MMP-like domain